MTTRERANRRELIVETAARLFTKQGYTDTPVRQIADAVGCTEAALYYHFKDGKRELLQCVVECEFPDLVSVVKACQEAKSLAEMVLIYGDVMGRLGPRHLEKLRWLLAEFGKLNPEEQSYIQQKQMNLHQGIAEIAARFVDSKERAEALAWVLVSVGFGYGQLFFNCDLRSRVDFPVDKMIPTVARLFALYENCEQEDNSPG